MRFYCIISLLILLSALLLLSGCGESVEDSDANILEPNEDFWFQNLPVLDNGSLIPPEDVPVITIEKTREDDDFYYWQLKATPAPTREDLVVGVSGAPSELNPLPFYFRNSDFLYITILQNQNSSTEIKVPRREYSLQIESTWDTIMSMIDAWSELLDDEIGTRSSGNHHFPAVDLPPLQTFDGYIIPQGFRFSYYLLGEPHSLEIPPQE